MTSKGISWIGIFRLGAVQASIGAIVMLATSLLNRVMVVEYSIAAAVPAGLVAWHYGVQLSRPYWGHGSDRTEHRSRWIAIGMAVLALGALLAIDATVMLSSATVAGTIMAVLAFTMIGIGVGMAGTGLLALLASRTGPARKAPAAAICWSMMVAGIVLAAGLAGHFLDPFSAERLALVGGLVTLGAFLVSIVALHGVERRFPALESEDKHAPRDAFRVVLAGIWRDDEARRFTFFVFFSMLAYSMQDLILEPFAGLVYSFTPGESTQLAGTQHAGVLLGMALAGIGGSLTAKRMGGNLKPWVIAGCLGSAAMLGALSLAAATPGRWPLSANVFGLGVSNGVFAVAAVGAMLGLAGKGGKSSHGARLGVWGAAQAIAFGLGGLSGALLVDAMRSGIGTDAAAFQTVFLIEALLFLFSALVASGTSLRRADFPQEALPS